MRRISTAKLRRWVLVGLAAGALVSSVLGALPIGGYGKGLFLNLGTELAGALVTYGLLELVIGRMERREVEREAEKKELEAKKADLIAQLGSSVKDVAVAAADELGRHLWLYDGSLQGAILNWANLKGAHLSNADLQGAELYEANLQEAQLVGTNLQGAILHLANLKGAILRGANLQGAILEEAELQEGDLVYANLKGAVFDKNTTLPDGTKWTPDTDMARFTDTDHPDFWHPDA